MFETEDLFGDRVSLTRVRWDSHILATHPEVEEFFEEIKAALLRPHCVYQSNSDPNCKLFYTKSFSRGKYHNLYLKVVVNYKNEPAEIVTAFLTGHLTGGELLWIKYP